MIEKKRLTNGFEYIEIENSYAKAKIALQGAHLFYYKNNASSSPLMWTSNSTFFEEGKAIRGGVPICFPWFGKLKEKPELPQHGFARVSPWEVVAQEEKEDGSTVVRLELINNKKHFSVWGYLFKLQLEIVVAKSLEMRLMIENLDVKSFEISTAFHSYFSVSDVTRVEIKGLENRRYYDALDGKLYEQKMKFQVDKEIDRVYFNSKNPLDLMDTHRTITLTSKGSNSLVVWNPWVEKSHQMKDMCDDGYKNMLCLETGNVMEDRVIVEPKKKHLLELMVQEH